MKTNTEQQLHTRGEKARHTSLSSTSRARIQAELSAYADMHTAPGAGARISPFSYLYSVRSLYAGVAALLIVVIGGGSAAFASEDAVPGDVLYGLKVAVAEPLQGAFIPDQVGKAQWHAILAERRLDEATTLLGEKKLDTKTETELQSAFATQVDQSNGAIDALAAAGKGDDALTLRSDLEARLQAQTTLLTLAVDGAATSTDGTTGAEAKLAVVDQSNTPGALLLHYVAGRAHAVHVARIALEERADESTATSTDARLALATAAAKSIEATEGASAAPVAARIRTAQAALQDAQSALSGDDTRDAQIHTGAAVRQIQEASILLRHKKLLAALMGTTTATTTATSTTETTASTTDSGE